MRAISKSLLEAIKHEAVYNFISETFQSGNIEDARSALIDKAYPVMAPDCIDKMYKFKHPEERVTRWMRVYRSNSNDTLHVQYLVELSEVAASVHPHFHGELDQLLEALPIIELSAPPTESQDFLLIGERHLVGTVINHKQYQAILHKVWQHFVTMDNEVEDSIFSVLDEMGGLVNES